jgi:hypothetical protein
MLSRYSDRPAVPLDLEASLLERRLMRRGSCCLRALPFC